MIEGEVKITVLDPVHGEESGRCRVAAAPEFGEIGGDGPEGDGHCPHAWIPCRIAVGSELFKVPGAAAETGFFLQLPGSCRVETLISMHETTRQGEFPAIGVPASLDQQNLECIVLNGEERYVDGDGTQRITHCISSLTRLQNNNCCNDNNEHHVIVSVTINPRSPA